VFSYFRGFVIWISDFSKEDTKITKGSSRATADLPRDFVISFVPFAVSSASRTVEHDR
jgi:hypothetical protein